MTAHHAIKITLTRPATNSELHRARRVAALASSTDRTRLLTVQRAKTPGRALQTLRRRLDGLLPIDVLTTHYPDRQGCVRLNFALSHAARTTIRQAAAACGQRPRDFDAVARHKEDRARRLTTQMEELLTQHTPEELMLCAADSLLSHHNRRPGGKPSSAPS
ncbi:hypothetical protein OG562_01660 [Streptomyces sp. NBC_01275]|uniref:hypothetical protein n=1 Tax=Streptomyces sp. NBC_01275 TaxID=2903807 RepID=UPI00224FE84A|nr:hypothetical protein [Streptomyces sp. NBC_01275]MCX4759712.1 hypothetical protein [Streptomyces sp. NBC_01275]